MKRIFLIFSIFVILLLLTYVFTNSQVAQKQDNFSPSEVVKQFYSLALKGEVKQAILFTTADSQEPYETIGIGSRDADGKTETTLYNKSDTQAAVAEAQSGHAELIHYNKRKIRLIHKEIVASSKNCVKDYQSFVFVEYKDENGKTDKIAYDLRKQNGEWKIYGFSYFETAEETINCR